MPESPLQSSQDAQSRTYPDDLVQTVYELWAFECDRSVARTMRRLPEIAPDRDRYPSPETVRYWIRTQGWDLRADEAIAGIAPNLRARQLGRLFVMGNAAIDTFAEVLAGEHDHQRQGPLQARVAVATKVVELLGLGTAVGRGEAPTIAALPKDRGDLSGLSPVELARLQREALLERQGRKG